MSAFQGETGIPIMVEAGRHPAGGAVTSRAGGLRPGGGKLPAVRVQVAPRTCSWGVSEGSSVSLRHDRRSLVARGTGHGTMRAGERELRRQMVESRSVAPGLYGMACLASGTCAVGAKAVH